MLYILIRAQLGCDLRHYGKYRASEIAADRLLRCWSLPGHEAEYKLFTGMAKLTGNRMPDCCWHEDLQQVRSGDCQ